MIIYFILLLIIVGLHCLYFGESIASLWFKSGDASLSWFGDSTFSLAQLLNIPLRPFEEDVILGILLGLVVVQLSRVLSQYTQWAKKLDEDFAAYFVHSSSLELTGMAIMSALAEEVIFRGWLQAYLGWILTSILFGILHIPPKKEHWPWTLSALLMGFVLGALFEWRASVTAPFIAHFTINYFNLHALSKYSKT